MLQNEEDVKATEKDDKTREEERARAAAFKLAGWPEGGPRLVKLLRAEWASLRTVESMFSKVLYVANLRTVSLDIFPKYQCVCTGNARSLCSRHILF